MVSHPHASPTEKLFLFIFTCSLLQVITNVAVLLIGWLGDTASEWVWSTLTELQLVGLTPLILGKAIRRQPFQLEHSLLLSNLYKLDEMSASSDTHVPDGWPKLHRKVSRWPHQIYSGRQEAERNIVQKVCLVYFWTVELLVSSCALWFHLRSAMIRGG